jgi:hypothetical protein
MGYLFVALFFLRREAPRAALLLGGFGLVYGSLVGLARMVQGAHFPTDVLWALGLIWMTAAGLHYFILPTLARWAIPLRQMRPGQRRILSVTLLLAVVVITCLFLTRRPYFKTFTFALPLSSDIQSLALTTDLALSRQAAEYGRYPQGRLRVHASGFGWVTARCSVTLTPRIRANRLELRLAGKPRGYFSELSYELEWLLPAAAEGHLDFHHEGTTP